MRALRVGAALAAMALLTACTSEPKPVYQERVTPEPVVTEYDDTLEPSAAVMSLVPVGADTVTVTDFDQLRLVLGFGAQDSAGTPRERSRFWRRVPRTAALSTGMLRPFDARLRAEFGFSQDDVSWEATYTGETEGWVLAFAEGTSMDTVARAVEAGVGPLERAIVDTDRRLVSSAGAPEPADSWAGDPALAVLGGREATSTYLARGCLEFDEVFGAGMQDRLASEPAAALRALEELDGFAIALGGELATVLLGAKRGDAFDRARLAERMPPTRPEFSLALSRPVADPSTGRLGYTLSDPVVAAELARKRLLPFAVCPG